MVRICDHMVRPNGPLPDGSTSFYVHADTLSLAPPLNLMDPGATHTAVQRRVAKAHGQRDVGDDVAALMRESKDIYKTAAEFLSVAVDELKKKYQHLNSGQQRMNLGNRMRAKFKKEHGK